MGELILEVKDLVKRYGDKLVLDKVSFRVCQGEIFGLFGINGAGKTTTLEIIEGLRSFSEGNIRLFSKDIKDKNEKVSIYKKMGVQLQSSALPDMLLVKEAMQMACMENNVPYREDLIQCYGLKEHENKKYSQLSAGLKRRLHLALALINDPGIVILDEPTAGLDIQGRAKLHSEILKLKGEGKTLILSSHDVAEIEELCDTIGIIKNGRIECFESVEAFKKSEHRTKGVGKTISFRTKNDAVLKDIEEKGSGYEDMTVNGAYVQLYAENINYGILRIAGLCQTLDDEIEDIFCDKISLETELRTYLEE